MIDSICSYLTNRMKIKMPELNDEKIEILDYGLHLIIGEIPKVFIMILLAFLLGVGDLALLAFLLMLPYRSYSGGFHLKTHIGCILCTTSFYAGTALLSKYITLSIEAKYIAIIMIWVFGMFMIKLYAPADTENVPVISKKERKKRKIASYIIFSISLIAAAIIQNRIISNILIFGMLIQTLAITRLAYKITKNKYGYEEYEKGNLKLD